MYFYLMKSLDLMPLQKHRRMDIDNVVSFSAYPGLAGSTALGTSQSPYRPPPAVILTPARMPVPSPE